jgi:hypothetical protein
MKYFYFSRWNNLFTLFSFKFSIFLLLFFSGFICIRAQTENQATESDKSRTSFVTEKGISHKQTGTITKNSVQIAINTTKPQKSFYNEIKKDKAKFSLFFEPKKSEKKRITLINKTVEVENNSVIEKEPDFDVEDNSDLSEFKPDEKVKKNLYFLPEEKYKEKFHWKPAFIQSGIFLGIQHGFRLMQKKTVREFDGPFFKDWLISIKNLRGWGDGDSPPINYIAHPLQGGVTGRIFINNSDNAKRQIFSKSADYWESRFKTFVWSALWSTQFEMGPFSEANIGNVGLLEKNGKSSMAWVDLVITPVVGTGVVIGEDAIDRYILKNWLERKKGGRVTPKIKFFRTLLTPTTSFSNILRGKYPWKRDFR